MNILIYTAFRTTRLKYITDFLFQELLGLKVEFTINEEYFKRSNGAKVNYSSKQFECASLKILPHPLLQQSSISSQKIVVRYYNSIPYFFHTSDEADFHSDIFAASFYLLTRYEEYLPYETDKHGRFPANQSLAYRAGFLETPLVNHWAIQLKNHLEALFPNFKCALPKYYFQPTFDIDLAWAYRFKDGKRIIGASLRDLKKAHISSFSDRLLVLAKQKRDPYDVYDFLINIHAKYDLSPIFFFLLGDYSEYDKNIAADHPKLRELIQRLSEEFTIGIHPSYQSNKDINQLQKEIECLRTITEMPVLKSRQHYLKLHLPTTYQWLLKCGIKEDHSMGYADEVGFRASVAHPFLWYDLEKEEITTIKIHSFQVMEVTLKEYLRLSPEEAQNKIAQLIKSTRAVGGQFISLWHNSSFSHIGGWEKWKLVYENMLAQGVKYN